VSDAQGKPGREGSLEAPTRHPLGWEDPGFHDPEALDKELERVFDICHGCRRCFNLCNSFPTLFDAIDASKTGELDGVDKHAYWDVVDHCYLCDMCYMTKCPYVPPHPWNVDFPHLMLRAKAVKHRDGRTRWRDKVLSATDAVGSIAGIPVVVEVVNAVNNSVLGRKFLDVALGVHPAAPVPPYVSDTLRKQLRRRPPGIGDAKPGVGTRGKVALFATCYANRNEPQIGLDLTRVFEHNGIEVAIAESENCCGMPKLELGDLQAVDRLRERNIPQLLAMIDRGYDIVAPVPSCVLMFKQELPLMFPDDADVARIKRHMYDPFEYLALRRRYRRGDGARRHVRSVRVPDAAAQGGTAAHRFFAPAGQDFLSRCLSPAGAEHRPEDPRCAAAHSRYRGGAHRALLRARRHLRGEAGVP